MKNLLRSATTLLLLLAATRAAALPPEVQALVDTQLAEITRWAADPAIVADVRSHNEFRPADEAMITQGQWNNLNPADPRIRRFTQSTSGQFLAGQHNPLVCEAFVSDARGLKVGFIAKTSNWSHAGKPKHEVPMSGQNWQGTIEVDQSAGRRQLQIAVPVRDGAQVIGSLVVGLDVSKFPL